MAARLACLVACLSALIFPACQENTPSAPALTATCEARPSSGAAPLTVAFVLTLSGAEGPVTAAVSYGDGQSGTNPEATHTYLTAGSYTASMNVTTPTQSARCSATVTVSGSATGGNQPPVLVIKTTPRAVRSVITGQAPLTVSFNMCTSSDPEGDVLYFLMDFDGDEKFDFGGITGAHCRADRVYALGTSTAVFCLQDRDADFRPLHDDVCQEYTIKATP